MGLSEEELVLLRTVGGREFIVVATTSLLG